MEAGPVEFIVNARDLARKLRIAKAAAIKGGLRDSVDVTKSMFNQLKAERSTLNDATVWWMLCNKVAGNSREAAHEEHDEFYQGQFDLGDYPIQRFGEPEVVIDGRRTAVFHRDVGWVEIKPDGEETLAAPERIPAYEVLAREPHIATDIVPVREFTVEDGDQRTKQMEENLARAEAALVRWVAGWQLIRPLLLAHPTWTLGMAVDDLRDRGEWPDQLDE